VVEHEENDFGVFCGTTLDDGNDRSAVVANKTP
jgi:hypothetical protein